MRYLPHISKCNTIFCANDGYGALIYVLPHTKPVKWTIGIQAEPRDGVLCAKI